MSTPFIQNISMIAVIKGDHIDPGENAILIQITDICYEAPTPKYPFKEVYQFEFMDLNGNSDENEELQITDYQAKELVVILQRALENNQNVMVHCHAGLCRSGAVVEVGTILGFLDTGAIRQPNILVKYKMLRYLGMTYEND